MRRGVRSHPSPTDVARLDLVRSKVDPVLLRFLAERRDEVRAVDPDGVPLVAEVERIVRAGGKRLRPAFCYWGHRAAGGEGGEAIVRAAAALELLHTFALIHDDVMDADAERRGVPTIHTALAETRRRSDPSADAERFGLSGAILAGDIAAVLADRLLAESGFPPDVLAAALRRYDRMRLEMAVGQFLDVGGGSASGDEQRARRVALLKTGSYTVEGPLHIGAALAGAGPGVLGALSRFAVPLGEAFQMRDDLLDGHPSAGSPERVDRLIGEAKSALDPELISSEAAEALASLADLLAMPT